MKDILDKLADDVTAKVIDVCAKVAEIHRQHITDTEYQKGYNQAVADIAAQIRELRL